MPLWCHYMKPTPHIRRRFIGKALETVDSVANVAFLRSMLWLLDREQVGPMMATKATNRLIPVPYLKKTVTRRKGYGEILSRDLIVGLS